jgi:hypothetical protein
MALLRSRCEADRLTSKHTKQSLRTQPSTTLGSKQPYRESGLVPWPILRVHGRPLSPVPGSDRKAGPACGRCTVTICRRRRWHASNLPPHVRCHSTCPTRTVSHVERGHAPEDHSLGYGRSPEDTHGRRGLPGGGVGGRSRRPCLPCRGDWRGRAGARPRTWLRAPLERVRVLASDLPDDQEVLAESTREWCAALDAESGWRFVRRASRSSGSPRRRASSVGSGFAEARISSGPARTLNRRLQPPARAAAASTNAAHCASRAPSTFHFT